MRSVMEKVIYNKPAWHGLLDADNRSHAGTEYEPDRRLSMGDFTHFNEQGRAKMVDVGEKPPTRRSATAAGAGAGEQ